MRNTISAVLLFCGAWAMAPVADAQNPDEVRVVRGPTPGWVRDHPMDLAAPPPEDQVGGGVWYLMVDTQRDLTKAVTYNRYAMKFLSEVGVQDESELSITFNPAYQALTLHKLVVHRDGKAIDRLAGQEIRVFAQETGADKHLYDGRYVATLLLEDIRVGDVLEYAYGRSGTNPIFGAKRHGSLA